MNKTIKQSNDNLLPSHTVAELSMSDPEPFKWIFTLIIMCMVLISVFCYFFFFIMNIKYRVTNMYRNDFRRPYWGHGLIQKTFSLIKKLLRYIAFKSYKIDFLWNPPWPCYSLWPFFHEFQIARYIHSSIKLKNSLFPH